MRSITCLLLTAALAPGCSILFGPSNYSSGEADAPSPLDAPPFDVGDAPPSPDVPPDVPGLDAPVDPGEDYWPASCATAETRTLLDAEGEPITPSDALRSALAVNDRVGIVSDRRLTVAGDALGRVVMGRSMANEVFVAVARSGPSGAGAPTLLSIDRSTLDATPITITNFPSEAGARVVDLAMVRLGTVLQLALLVETAPGVRATTSCAVTSGGCALEPRVVLAAGYFPMVIGLVLEASTVYTLTMGPRNESGIGACLAQDGGLPDCDDGNTVHDRSGEARGDGVESTGGLLAVFPTAPDLTGALPDRGAVNLVPSAITAAFDFGDEAFTLVQAEGAGAGLFDLRNVNVNCLGGGGCLPLAAADPAFAGEAGEPQILHAAPLTSTYAFAALLTGYDDALGTEVRLYGLNGEAGLPLAARPYVTLGSGRIGTAPTNGRSMAMTAVSDGSSYDVFTVTVGDTSGIESAYLSAIRYCR